MVEGISCIFSEADVGVEIQQFFTNLLDEDVNRRVDAGEIHYRHGYTILTLILLVPTFLIILLAIAARFASSTSQTACPPPISSRRSSQPHPRWSARSWSVIGGKRGFEAGGAAPPDIGYALPDTRGEVDRRRRRIVRLSRQCTQILLISRLDRGAIV